MNTFDAADIDRIPMKVAVELMREAFQFEGKHELNAVLLEKLATDYTD